MFTGLIETVGTVKRVGRGDKSLLFTIQPSLSPFEVRIGDSVATNGVCLTVETCTDSEYTVRAVSETVAQTTLCDLSTGAMVNLERAMLVTARLDGHLVQGHVDTTATLVSIEPAGDSHYYTFQPDPQYMKYFAQKGSVAIDGISLTIARSTSSTFSVALIPHTIKETTLSQLSRGSRVNVECDVLARYMEQLMKFGVQPARSDEQMLGLLERNGF